MQIFILDDSKRPVPCDDVRQWEVWMDQHSALLSRVFKINDEPVTVSTVFLGLNLWPRGVPRLFETMVLGGTHNHYQRRCATWHQAKAQQLAACHLVAPWISHVLESDS